MHVNLITTLRSDRFAAFRRAIAVLCVSLFVMSGMFHAPCDFDLAPKQTVSASAVVSSGDASGDEPAKSGMEIGHCHSCTGMALLDQDVSFSLNALDLKIALPALRALASAEPRTDTPPPKSLA